VARHCQALLVNENTQRVIGGRLRKRELRVPQIGPRMDALVTSGRDIRLQWRLSEWAVRLWRFTSTQTE